MSKPKNPQTKLATGGAIERFIPLNRLKKSPRNARKTPHPQADIEALAASIAAHGILQAPVVEPEVKGNKPTGHFLVTIGEGRRQAQLLRAKRKEIAKDEPIRCLVETAHDAFEISLAENAVRTPMHPADEFEAFHQLHSENGLGAEDIAARFGVTAAVVKQRLKLANVSPLLIAAYRNGELTLDQLTAFAISSDHKRQERVFENLSPHDGRTDILAALNEDHVPASDPRAIFIGKDAYVEAGGAILADLFDQEGEGYFTDAALLFDLVAKKLEGSAEAIRAEGWKWVDVLPRFDYGTFSDRRRVYPQERPLTDDEQRQLEALEEQYEALQVDDGKEAERIEAAIDALRGENVFTIDDIARAGAVVTLDHNGTLAIHRGFVRPEDEVVSPKPRKQPEGGPAPLSEKLVAELTAYRTAFLRDALAKDAGVALQAVLHGLAEQAFYRHQERGSCLGMRLLPTELERHAPGIAESEAERAIAERHAEWAKRLPEEAEQLWRFLGSLALAEQMALLAHCASLALDCVQQGGFAAKPLTADLAEALAFDMAAHWSPTAANYLGRVSKDRILEAVREGVSKEAADNLASFKKQALAEEAARRLEGKGWLPVLLRRAA